MSKAMTVLTSTLLLAAVPAPILAQSRFLTLVEGQVYKAKIVPDMTGDGYPELLVGSPKLATSFGGRVRLYSGKDMELLLELHGIGTYVLDQLGAAVTTVADLDGDGVRDIVAGAPHGGAHPTGQGQVFVFSGKDGRRLHTMVATASWDGYFGCAVEGVGDVDGDSVEDILVGSMRSSFNAAVAGAVHLFSGRTGKLIYRIDGLASGAFLGWSLAGMGDLDGDNCPDFAVGANGDYPNGQTGQIGSVTVFSGRSGKILHKSWGTTRSDFYGYVARIGDVDGDGAADMAVGASEAGTFRPGYARVISGKTGKHLYQVAGDFGGDNFGSVAGLGDVDGDRVPDFVVGANQGGAWFPSGSGYARVFSGRTGKALFTLSARSNESLFGGWVSGAGDLDQDGTPDLALTAFVSSSNRNHVLVYSTRDLSLVTDTQHLSLQTAGTQTLSLDAGAAHAGSSYWILGSYTGTRTGIPLGGLRLPLDFDAYTELTILLPNSTVFPNSKGTLDGMGRATATFVVPPGLPPLSGFGLHHAFLVFDRRGRFVFTSNAALLRLE